jgi:hypothetical protein
MDGKCAATPWFENLLQALSCKLMFAHDCTYIVRSINHSFRWMLNTLGPNPETNFELNLLTLFETGIL